MLGWWIVISMQTPEERDRADQDTRRAALLANWEASVNGSRWVHQLVEQGKATQLSSGGYPNRFTAKACDVLPLFANGLPKHDGPTVIGEDYVLPGSWTGNVIIHPDRIAACPPDKLLTIDVWDQS